MAGRCDLGSARIGGRRKLLVSSVLFAAPVRVQVRLRDLEALLVRLLLQRNGRTGASIADHLKVPLRLLEPWLRICARQLSFAFARDEVIARLVNTHFRQTRRTLRFCHARDLPVLVQHQCQFHGLPPVVTDDLLDEAVATYFFGDQEAR